MTKKLLLTLAGITGAIGITTAVAVTVVNNTYNVGDAVYLSWGEKQSTTLDSLSSLSSTPEFRSITVGKTTTNLSSGFTTINFTLTPSEDKTLEGVVVTVYKDISSSSQIGKDTSSLKVVEGTSNVYKVEVDSISITDMKETTSYLLAFTYVGSENAINETTTTIGGSLSISLGWKDAK